MGISSELLKLTKKVPGYVAEVHTEYGTHVKLIRLEADGYERVVLDVCEVCISINRTDGLSPFDSYVEQELVDNVLSICVAEYSKEKIYA